MSRNEHTIWNLIWDWSRIVDRARYIKSDPARRQKSFRNGVCAVIYAALAVLCACALLLFNLLPIGIILNVIIAIFAIAIGGFGTLVCIITALIYWFCQLSLNKRPFTWVSLALMLLAFGGAVVVPFVVFA